PPAPAGCPLSLHDALPIFGALSAVRTPKIAKTLPKPLAVTAAKRLIDADLRAGEERAPWVLARDAAVLALLYGSGLRISEALGLDRKSTRLNSSHVKSSYA